MTNLLRLAGLLIVFQLVSTSLFSQKRIDTAEFFMDEHPIEVTLVSDFKTLLAKRVSKEYQPADITMKFPDSTEITEPVRIQTRGEFRMKNCYMPSIMINFKNQNSPKLKPLGKLKLVCGCGTNSDDEQLIIKEYISYKIYNLLTPMSFRVRLLKINYEDTKGKVRKYSQYGFLIESVEDLATRNKCVEVKGTPFNTESTNRQQMTLVAIYQFMIGNTDWAVPNYHNIKLIKPAKGENVLPIVIPYDLDYSGIVDASYAVPPEELGINSVRDRVYRGFPRSMEELDAALEIYKSQKKNIWAVVNNCAWLSNKYKKEMISYLESFYKIIDSKNQVKNNFIDGARTN
jgi:hypothetical protein